MNATECSQDLSACDCDPRLDTVVHSVRRLSGIAGQITYSAVVEYPGEGCHGVAFVGSTYGAPGPVVMVTEAHTQTFVVNPGRFGDTFGPEWVRRFFA